jgi:hypothetical protein
VTGRHAGYVYAAPRAADAKVRAISLESRWSDDPGDEIIEFLGIFGVFGREVLFFPGNLANFVASRTSALRHSKLDARAPGLGNGR